MAAVPSDRTDLPLHDHVHDDACQARTITVHINGKIVQTPHFLANTSRGSIPHLTPDNVVRHTQISGIYVALEDFVEKLPDSPPVCDFSISANDIHASRLRQFIACPDSSLLILGPRRCPPVESPVPNKDVAMSVLTSVGFRSLPIADFATISRRLNPDIVIGPGDIPPDNGRNMSKKMSVRIVDRTIKWMNVYLNQDIEHVSDDSDDTPSLYAPLLPLPVDAQTSYLDMLCSAKQLIHGLTIYDPDHLCDLPEELSHLPRLCFSNPPTPHEVLLQIAQGIDMFCVPFLTEATDAGICLDFVFPCESASAGATHDDTEESIGGRRVLDIDMWDVAHAKNTSPLSETCKCYTCTDHHRAYIQHLLITKEMLAWVLLQIHNHAVMDRFFAGVRASIEAGTFVTDSAIFRDSYTNAMPDKTGTGPRLRGYQYRTKGPAPPKANTAAYSKYASSVADPTQ